ncbi:MAG: hydroxymethylbilane synthase [Chloroflexi bacterium]|nr:hydroxymethylbilane synthase [Chloroflexota bacterium]
MPDPLRIATRGSPLALRQAEMVRDLLAERHSDLPCMLAVVRTTGDRFLDHDIAALGGKGVFVAEIEQALLRGEVDLAVHSLKDLPAELPDGLILGAVPEREDPRDVLVSAGGRLLSELPAGARIGTSSLRRAAQLRACRPDLEIVGLRGNVGTRLARLDGEGLDGVVLALAGLRRLGLADRAVEVFDPERLVPAPGQGALADEARAGSHAAALAAALDHPPTPCAVAAERAFLAALGGSCTLPLGAYARVEGTELVLDGMLAAPSGAPCLRASRRGPADAPAALGRRLADVLLAQGAAALVAQARAG